MTLQNSPFLRIQRNFPSETQQLTVEIDKSYVDIANAVNSRTLGIFPTNAPIAIGENWYIQDLKLQGLRRVYPFTTFASITHGINISSIYGFVRIFGAFTDGTSWYPLPFVSPTAANQVGVSVSASQIVFAVGGGAPTPTKGQIVLEWVVNV